MVLIDEMIYEINHILNCGYEVKPSYYPCSYERNFHNWVEKPEKLNDFFRLLYAVAKIVFIIARIIASLCSMALSHSTEPQL